MTVAGCEAVVFVCITILVLFCVGDPDLLDAITAYIRAVTPK